MADRASRLLTDVTIETTPDAGHGLLLQYPVQVTKRILTFIESEREVAN